MLQYSENNNKRKRGFVLLFFIMLIALLAPQLTTFAPEAQIDAAENHLQAPSLQHFFGTDQLGRDVFSRTLHGGRLSLLISVSVMMLATILGALYGAVSAYQGGMLDNIMMRLLDAFLAFPLLFLLAACIALFGNAVQWLIIVLSLTAWMDIARLVRAEVRSLKARHFILRAQALGLARLRILFVHILPSVAPTIIAAGVLRAADIMLIESTLSFLGIG